MLHQDRDWFHDFTIWNRTVKRQRTAMGAWLGVGGCYEVDCTSPTLHSTKSTKSTSATVRHQSTSGSNAKVQGRWISRRRQKAEISSNCQDFKISGFLAICKSRWETKLERFIWFMWQFLCLRSTITIVRLHLCTLLVSCPFTLHNLMRWQSFKYDKGDSG